MTKELENKLKISENTVIHCPTVELAKQVLNIFNDLGLKWSTSRSYIEHHNWNIYKNNTIYHPIDGMFSYLQFAKDENYEIIHAKDFIALHPFDLENYIPKGQLEGFPKEIIKRMLDCQEEQGNKRDVTIFEDRINAIKEVGGFSWTFTYEKFYFWDAIINHKNFDLFFEKYPKICSKCHKKENNITIFLNTTCTQPCIIPKDKNQDFKLGDKIYDIPKDKNQGFDLGDKVYDIMYRSSGIITKVKISKTEYPLTVELENGETNVYTIDGRVNSCYKTPQLLHYKDDYDYITVDFKNLLKRWRSEEGGYYYFIKRDEHDFNLDKIYRSLDYYNSFSNELYKIGNYFQTREQAQEVLDNQNKKWIK